jgi:hypothetical protein
MYVASVSTVKAYTFDQIPIFLCGQGRQEQQPMACNADSGPLAEFTATVSSQQFSVLTVMTGVNSLYIDS